MNFTFSYIHTVVLFYVLFSGFRALLLKNKIFEIASFSFLMCQGGNIAHLRQECHNSEFGTFDLMV